MQFTKLAQVGYAAMEEDLEVSVLLHPPYSDSNLPFQISVTIFCNSCIHFKYKKNILMLLHFASQ